MASLHPLASETLRLAHLGQHESLRGSCALVQRVVRRLVLGREPPPSERSLRDLQGKFRRLLARDFANAQAGAYPMSLLFQIPLTTYARRMPALVADLPRVMRRMKRRDYQDLPADVDVKAYPPYYRRTFHWQSDGYLSRRSAELYDVGVELLFGGTADVMRRQIIPPIVEHGRRLGRPMRVLDVACGTGRALEQLLRAMPSIDAHAIDLSPYYIDEVHRRLRQVATRQGNAESLPYADASFDAVFSVYLFHELPRNARRRVWSEMLRVLRPGGLLVIEDSIQESDAEDLAFFAERFSEDLHEPT
jgi:SAM-dependent methyltransferase